MTYMSKSSYLHFINELDENNAYGLTSLKKIDGCILCDLFELSPLYNKLDDDTLSHLYQLHKKHSKDKQNAHKKHNTLCVGPHLTHDTRRTQAK